MLIKYSTITLNANFFWDFKKTAIFAKQYRIKGRFFTSYLLTQKKAELKNIDIKPIRWSEVGSAKPIGFFYVQMLSVNLSKY